MDDINWKFVVPDEEQSHFIELDPGVYDVQMEVRCRDGAVVNAITRDGETLYLGQGDLFTVEERLSSMASVEIAASGPFSYRCLLTEISRTEKIDPTPASVSVKIRPQDNLAIAVRAEVEKHLRTLHARGMFEEDVDPDELVDDLLNGDHEFDEEEEEFGTGFDEDLMAPEEPSGPPVQQGDTPLPEGPSETAKPPSIPQPEGEKSS